ncbi:MAG: DUF4491 family protein [Muribaculaceae bacterium]|nr:DUF4491 family protein [Muribaculaceae bacterium]
MDAINLEGLAIGLVTFLIIGVFHPLVIKGEYYFGSRINWAFLLAGIAALAAALFSGSLFWSGILAVVAFSCFWSILEVNHQTRRVLKGWFPMNPARKDYYRKKLEKMQKKEACAFHNGQTSLTNISITEET